MSTQQEKSLLVNDQDMRDEDDKRIAYYPYSGINQAEYEKLCAERGVFADDSEVEDAMLVMDVADDEQQMKHKEPKARFKDLTPSRDATESKVIYENQLHPKRMIRITTRGDDHTNLQLKLFKCEYEYEQVKAGHYRVKNMLWHGHQFVNLNVSEMDDIFDRLADMGRYIHLLKDNVDHLPELVQPDNFEATIEEDKLGVHYYLPVNDPGNKYRHVAISCIHYNNDYQKDFYRSVYIQLKMFRADDKGVLRKAYQLALTFQELYDLVTKATYIKRCISKNCYEFAHHSQV